MSRVYPLADGSLLVTGHPGGLHYYVDFAIPNHASIETAESILRRAADNLAATKASITRAVERLGDTRAQGNNRGDSTSKTPRHS